MAYAVIRTDLMSGTKQPADLVSLRFYDASGNKAEVENGVIVKLQGYEDGEREVMKAVAASAGDDLNDCAIVAAPEVMYDERKKNLDEFINEAGKATRGYIPRSRNVFSVTKEGFVGGTVPPRVPRSVSALVARLMPLAKVLVSVRMLRSLVVIPITSLRLVRPRALLPLLAANF